MPEKIGNVAGPFDQILNTKLEDLRYICLAAKALYKASIRPGHSRLPSMTTETSGLFIVTE
jgi:hypothetical protein